MPKLLSLTPQKIIKMLEKKGKLRALLHSPKFYMVATLKNDFHTVRKVGYYICGFSFKVITILRSLSFFSESF